MDIILELKNINKTYNTGRDKINALRNVNLCIKRGEFISIIGPSGSGKSTLLNIIGLMNKPDSGRGTIKFEKTNISNLTEKEIAKFRLDKIGFVFQDFNLLEDFSLEDNIALPLLIKSGKNTLSLAEKNKVENILKEMNLINRRKHKPNQVSGGQKQRTAIGRALINSPSLLLADEPTGNLDKKSGEKTIDFLSNLCKKNKLTLVIVSHDIKIANQADKIIELNEGRIVKTVTKQ